jgi:DNA integrity scanning protein DisA with diadenylate cyclase activity
MYIQAQDELRQKSAEIATLQEYKTALEQVIVELHYVERSKVLSGSA